MSNKITNTGFISDDDLVEVIDEEDTLIEPKKPTRKETYVFSEKRQQNLAKARQKKEENKAELKRLKEKEELEKQVVEREAKAKEPIQKPKVKKGKKKVVYVEESCSSEEEEIVVVRKKKTKNKSAPMPTYTPQNSPQRITISHDAYIRNILRM